MLTIIGSISAQLTKSYVEGMNMSDLTTAVLRISMLSGQRSDLSFWPCPIKLGILVAQRWNRKSIINGLALVSDETRQILENYDISYLVCMFFQSAWSFHLRGRSHRFTRNKKNKKTAAAWR